MTHIHHLMLEVFSISLLMMAMPFVADGQTDAPTTGKVVATLPYRGGADERSSKPYSIGMFESRTFFSFPHFMGTDWEGNIYILDPQTSQSSVLKRFDKNGRFCESWQTLDAQAGKGIAVTKDGYIWTGLSRLDVDDYAGLPIVVYRKGKQDPVLDWRQKLPQELEDRIRKTLKEREIGVRKGWMMIGAPEGGPSQVSFRFMRAVAGQVEPRIYAILWLLVHSDGSQSFDVKIQIFDVRIGKMAIPQLAPDGRLWGRESDFNLSRFTWSKVWWWEEGKEKGEPLIDRTTNKEPWADKITIGKSPPPQIQIDTKGHIYLIWEREYPEPQMRQFQVEGKILDGFPLEGERALVVLDSQRRLVTYLLWTPYSVEIQDKWVKPLPDGSGFYRIQFLEKEAVVYFHPLPQ